ncbi:uncharacterized protein LOC131319133 [Rhododendron vialii]|uniref:uncharacterized protein LOC131319133 n=1 Tax=Rhododendron vialii TaxID=182163 RepID=UPI00265E2F48|nr:uncharacterized protein LOC131319133 [Rhododendron vialii]
MEHERSTTGRCAKGREVERRRAQKKKKKEKKARGVPRGGGHPPPRSPTATEIYDQRKWFRGRGSTAGDHAAEGVLRRCLAVGGVPRRVVSRGGVSCPRRGSRPRVVSLT